MSQTLPKVKVGDRVRYTSHGHSIEATVLACDHDRQDMMIVGWKSDEAADRTAYSIGPGLLKCFKTQLSNWADYPIGYGIYPSAHSTTTLEVIQAGNAAYEKDKRMEATAIESTPKASSFSALKLGDRVRFKCSYTKQPYEATVIATIRPNSGAHHENYVVVGWKSDEVASPNAYATNWRKDADWLERIANFSDYAKCYYRYSTDDEIEVIPPQPALHEHDPADDEAYEQRLKQNGSCLECQGYGQDMSDGSPCEACNGTGKLAELPNMGHEWSLEWLVDSAHPNRGYVVQCSECDLDLSDFGDHPTPCSKQVSSKTSKLPSLAMLGGMLFGAALTQMSKAPEVRVLEPKQESEETIEEAEEVSVV